MEEIYTIILISVFCTSIGAPQQPEINDQFQITGPVNEKPETDQPTQTEQQTQLNNQTQPDQNIKPEQHTQTQSESVAETAAKTVNDTAIVAVKENEIRRQYMKPEVSFTVRVYRLISEPFFKVINAPKVNEVLRNIGTCTVNGAMELFSYYLPAPFMPLLATAAGLIIPFEPVVMLKERMPVTSYRRAFQTAMNTFLRTFDKYKVDEEEFDPYMTRRFNRRLMNDNREKNPSEKTGIAGV